MIDWMFLVLIIVAILFLLLSIEYQDNKFWCVTFILLDTVIWFLLAAAVMNIEVPYEMYNATSGRIETGYHTLMTFDNTVMVLFFAMFGIIMMIYGIGYVLGPVILKVLFKRR